MCWPVEGVAALLGALLIGELEEPFPSCAVAWLLLMFLDLSRSRVRDRSRLRHRKREMALQDETVKPEPFSKPLVWLRGRKYTDRLRAGAERGAPARTVEVAAHPEGRCSATGPLIGRP